MMMQGGLSGIPMMGGGGMYGMMPYGMGRVRAPHTSLPFGKMC